MDSEVLVRLISFFGIFTVIALWELSAPRRRLTVSKTGRWGNNLTIILFDTVLVRLLFSVAGMGIAAAANQGGWGLFNHLQFFSQHLSCNLL